MALRNLHAISNRYISGAVNPNLIGTWESSAGSVQLGDASFTGAIATDVLTVSAIASGALAPGSLVGDGLENVGPGTTIVQQLSGPTGGLGTYQITPAPQTVSAEAMSATGPGTRTPQFQSFTGIPMQFQALSAGELAQIQGLNLQGTKRAVWMNGQAQGVVRPAVVAAGPDGKGGDLLLAPTGLTGETNDTWLVVGVLEGWDAAGWCHVAVVLQMATQDQ